MRFQRIQIRLDVSLSYPFLVRKWSKSYTVVADIVFVASIYKCPLVEEWKFSWYRATIDFYVAWGHFWDQEQYYQKTKHGA